MKRSIGTILGFEIKQNKFVTFIQEFLRSPALSILFCFVLRVYPENWRLVGVVHVVLDVAHFVVDGGEGLFALNATHLNPDERR